MRLRSFSLAAALAGCLALGAPALAQRTPEPSPSHLAAARDFMVAAGAGVSIDRILPVLVNDVRRIAVTRPELAKELEEVLKSMEPELERQRQQGYAIAARAYATHMTEAELKEGTVFFRSPAGRKYVEMLPSITETLVNDVTAWSQLAGEYLMTRVRAEMAKKGYQLQ